MNYGKLSKILLLKSNTDNGCLNNNYWHFLLFMV